MDPVMAIRTQATYLAVVRHSKSAVQLLPVSVTYWYVFPLSDKGNTVAA